MGIEKALQNQYGSHLVDDLAMPGERAAGGVQVAVGFSRGEAFVPEVNGQGKGRAQGVGEGVGSFSLRADIAGHVERIAEDDGGAGELAKETPERLQILLCVPADEGQDRLGGEAKLVGDGHADAAATEVESEEAIHRRRIAKGRPDRDEAVSGGTVSPGTFGGKLVAGGCLENRVE
jgi:hypothetical protein